MLIAFRVNGRPVPQGSMVASYNKKAGVAHVHHVQGAALALWRAELRQAAIDAGAVIATAPVSLFVAFGMPRPAMHMMLYRGRRIVRPAYIDAQPKVMPDLDKLLRALMDALNLVCYEDDAQVTSILAQKVYRSYTEVIITDARGQDDLFKVGAENGTGVEIIKVDDLASGQVRLSDLREEWRE